ncbi:MAG: hypothetical protein R3F43_14015 [bacterium]
MVLDSPMRVRTARVPRGPCSCAGQTPPRRAWRSRSARAAREVGDPLLTYVDGDPGLRGSGLARRWPRRRAHGAGGDVEPPDAAGGLIAADSVPLANGRHVAVGTSGSRGGSWWR